tara:strand:- start:169 stop:1209 length:1041 start_codon:yes stop_codon:yes gene_type:complete
MSKAAELANLIGNINAGGGGVNRNLLINSAMNVSQRGTSQAFAHDGTTNAYLIDRWRFAINSTDELDGTLAQVADDPIGGGGYALKWTTGTAESAIASDEYGYLTQKIEAQNLQHIQNGNSNAKSLTLCFYVKSSITGTFSVGLYKPDNTARQNNRTYTINSANTWEKKSVTFEGDTSGGGINNDNGEGIWVSWNLFAGSDFKGGGSTSGWVNYSNATWADGLATDAVMTTAGATWLMTQCQLEIGQNETEFEHEPVERTLAKCQRYFQKSIQNGTTSYPSSGGFARGMYLFPVQMRDDPTGTFTDAGSGGSSVGNETNKDGYFNTYGSLGATAAGQFSWTMDAEL